MEYRDYLKTKVLSVEKAGFDIEIDRLNDNLFPFQKALVKWAIRRGRAGIFADTGLGKALCDFTKVITPYGYQDIKNIKVGNTVIGSNGKPTRVIGVFPQGIRKAYKITFSDGSVSFCDEEHLWNVRTKVDKYRNKPWRTLTLKEIQESGLQQKSQQGNKWFIPTCKPMQFAGSNLPIDPYLLGYLIGNGCMSQKSVSVTIPDKETVNELKKYIFDNLSLYYRGRYDYAISGKHGLRNDIRSILDRLGFKNSYSYNKFIPKEYKWSKLEDRINLLQGLLDSDGTISKDNVIEYSTSSITLANDVLFVVHSLGGTSTFAKKKVKGYLDSYRLIIAIPGSIKPFRLSRKANKYHPRPKYEPQRTISKIEYFGKRKMTCIKVDAEDGLFVIENGIVTHNTIILLEWANQIVKYTGKEVLVLAPLCVSQQTVKEGEKFGIPIRYLRDHAYQEGITITNYEMMDRFDFSKFVGLVLDESSIIKHQNSKTRQRLIELAKPVPYKLSLSATPAPNDFMELGSQSEFLGVMDASEMLAMFFVHDGGSTSKWRLKGHGKKSFWEWLSTWAMVVKKPSDIGFDDSGYDLPNLNMIEHIVESPIEEGELFPTVASKMLDRNKARRESIENRVKECANIVNATDEQFIVWCHLNRESDKLTKAIKGAVEIRGAHDIGEKERRLMSFINGNTRVLVTKPKIAGFGLNLQHVHNMAFVGLSDSWEEFYQAIRREWRFGQKNEVNVHIISAQSEGAVLRNIKRKEQQAQDMSNEMVVYMHDKMNQELYSVTETIKEYVTDFKSGENWISYLGDCVEVIKQIEDCSVDYTIFSPPFASLYSYTDDVRDMGNSKDDSDFFDHFSYLMPELYRITKEGRLVSFHCMNIPSTKVKDGYIGLRDFRGELIQAFVKAGFIYHSEVTVWKDPVTQMQRTKALGLLHKQLKKDSAMSRMALPDYIVTLRKPGENKAPISHTPEDYPVEVWQRVAEPIWKDIGPDKNPLIYPTWHDIDPSNTLNKCGARESDDEKHICPLQLPVIERCLNLWTNPGDIVFSPFGGIGSEGYQALKMGRKAILIELKRSYWESNCKNLSNAKTKQLSLFDVEHTKKDLDKISKAGLEGAKAGEKLRDKFIEEIEPKKEETITTKQDKDVDII